MIKNTHFGLMIIKTCERISFAATKAKENVPQFPGIHHA